MTRTFRMLRAAVAVAMCTAMAGAASLQAQAADAEAVRQVDVSWGQAFRTCDLAAMGRILHDDLVFIVQNGTAHHKDDQMKSVARCDMKQMDVTPARVKVLGGSAITHGTLDYRLEGARATSGRLLYSRTWVKEGGVWRMIQHQSTAVPAK
ncbi:MAG: nuclear transport factor 2 family protein [Alphaproteobacteria bacterium]